MRTATPKRWAAFLQGRWSLVSLGTKPNKIPGTCAGSGVLTGVHFAMRKKKKKQAGCWQEW